jgi:hypothetical protein
LPPDHDPLVSGEITTDLEFPEPGLRHQLTDHFALIVTHLQSDHRCPDAGTRKSGEDLFDHLGPFRPCKKRRRRLP